MEAFKKLVPRGIDRSKLIIFWVRAYIISNAESDRLLAQAPLTAELLNYLEAQNTPEAEDLADKLQSLVVARELDELRIDGAIEVGQGAYIV